MSGGATHLALTVTAALVGAGLATLVRLPAAPLLGAMAGAAACTLVRDQQLAVPGTVRWLVYAAVGTLLGLQVTAESLVALRGSAVTVGMVVLAFVVFGLLLALALWWLADLDPYTALLATAPGGIAQMGVLSAEAKANVPLVLAVHVLRVVSVIVVMSLGLKLMGGRT